MKVTSIALGIAALGSVDAKKTPFQRRIEKSFNLLDEWAYFNMANHTKYTDIVPELDNQSKFNYKVTTVRSKVVDYYLKLVGKIASGCASLDNCEEYLTCTGVGDRLNDLTRSKPMVQESDYFLEFTKSHLKRSLRKSLSLECGADQEKLDKFTAKFETLVEKFREWRLQCSKFPASKCPAYCDVIERNSGKVCKEQGWTKPPKDV
ncbi:Oidioi.mRNA.OKI2018_I69.XSR.g16281.t1.cds [Oikopleura dioica]|uniref:Oidioi.mRNA.OKI2018_I69.XSR.g16281.t1.cds n=1 Tax=Oikopleura dioica TaxID=34765 RepID=A0ABN7SLX5_OIKDI|nr:Oidioi.mRNA.OKI2018_I69.XSR.g16281.t1.cds [Oikopleura dioica]